MPNPSPLMCKEAFLVFCNYHWIAGGSKIAIPMSKETYAKGLQTLLEQGWIKNDPKVKFGMKPTALGYAVFLICSSDFAPEHSIAVFENPVWEEVEKLKVVKEVWAQTQAILAVAVKG